MEHRTTRRTILLVMLATLVGACNVQYQPGPDDHEPAIGERVEHTDAEWRALLSPEQYHVLRDHGTEAPFTNAFWDHHVPGTYRCAGCGAPVFTGDAMFDSGTGWPSFFRPIDPRRLGTTQEGLYTEVHCASCDGHLGHVFPDGPAPTGLRYCMNSAAMTFRPDR